MGEQICEKHGWPYWPYATTQPCPYCRIAKLEAECERLRMSREEWKNVFDALRQECERLRKSLATGEMRPSEKALVETLGELKRERDALHTLAGRVVEEASIYKVCDMPDAEHCRCRERLLTLCNAAINALAEHLGMEVSDDE